MLSNNNNEKSSCSYTIHVCVIFFCQWIHPYAHKYMHTAYIYIYYILYTAAQQTRLGEFSNGCFWHFAFSMACSPKSYVDTTFSDLVFVHTERLSLSSNRSANLTEIIWELLCIVRMPVAHFSLSRTYTLKSKEPAKSIHVHAKRMMTQTVDTYLRECYPLAIICLKQKVSRMENAICDTHTSFGWTYKLSLNVIHQQQ